MSPNGNGKKIAHTMPIITPEQTPPTFKMTNQAGKPVFVAEVPDCRFEGLPISLSTGKIEDIPRVKAMVLKFRQMWHDIAELGKF